jgi:rare lipoprotein A (peptidoglycan hydrolase)
MTLYYSGPVTWNNSQFYTFDKPSMEYLPGSITFRFANNCGVTVPIASGDTFVKSAVAATLKSHAGAPIAGGSATAYVHGAWTTVGATNSNGVTCQLFDGQLGNTSVRMTSNGTSQMLTQSQPANSVYAFTTALVTVQLKNHAGALTDTGSASYYAGGWHAIGDTSNGKVAAEMLPGSYSFAMVFNGTRQQLNGVAVSGTATTVTFQTAEVTVELRSSAGDLLDTGNASYYAGGWHTIGDTSNGQVTVEMLPGSYSFAMTYLGTRQQLNSVGVAGTATTVTFTTGAVHSASATASSYYANGWKPFTQDMELLPGSYTFHFTDSTPNTVYALTGGVVNTIH